MSLPIDLLAPLDPVVKKFVDIWAEAKDTIDVWRDFELVVHPVVDTDNSSGTKTSDGDCVLILCAGDCRAISVSRIKVTAIIGCTAVSTCCTSLVLAM